MICEALASVLRSGRDHFNAAFAEARRRYPELDVGAFNTFLGTTLDSLLRQTSTLSSEQQAGLVMAAYEVGLELVGERLAGSDSRPRVIETGWAQILPANLTLVAAHPHAVLSSVSNALHTLASSPGAQPTQWCQHLRELGPRCTDLSTFLKLGQVLAWRAGLAQFRQGALEAAQQLPEALAVAAVGGPASATWASLSARLANDRWFDPSATSDRARLKLAGKVGAFRGLGGNFVQPPEVASWDDQLLVRSGDDCWWLLADAFGSTLHRATKEEFNQAKSEKAPPSPFQMNKARVSRGPENVPNPVPEGASSIAMAGQTLALTSRVSFRVSLIAV